MRRFTGRRIALIGAFLTLLLSASAYAAFQQLPPGDQVNNDPAAGIDPSKPVDLGDPTNADVVGGALAAGGKNVPWTDFRQKTSGADQIFSRSFAKGAWTTRGHGTVGGRSSASPTFLGSLNFDQSQDGEAPAIDFAGAGRTVPWATWYENTTGTGFGNNNVFASRFDSAQDKWVFAGQGRGNGGSGPEVPSLNIHTNEDAENPSVAGGSVADPTKPGPWITWQETDSGKDQIFVVKPIGPGTTTCPVGTKPAGGAPVGGFCWQQTGVERVNSNADPSLNVDTTRNGIEPDIAFTGTNDGVPWVVWYETDNGALGNNNEQVFAAKGVDPTNPANPAHSGTADGGIEWVAVGGNGGSGVLDTSGTHSGPCMTDIAHEHACTLNANPAADAEDPRVAAGTMTPGAATSPWVVWDEGVPNSNDNKVFASRLVNGQFKLANGGQPIATGDRPDITFSGNTPYVSWHHDGKALYGHFVTPDQFVSDNGPVGTNVSAEVRAPISSSCTANPFNQDGAACQGGAIGTPFFLFSDGDASGAKLFANAYQTDAPTTGGSSAVTTSSATVKGTVNPQGGPVTVQFQFGTSTAYGQTTAAQKLGPANSALAFSGTLSGLPADTTIHYRAVANTDFGQVVGADQTLHTAAVDHTAPKLKLKVAKIHLGALLASGKLKVKVTANEASRIRLVASIKANVARKRTVTLGQSSLVTFQKKGTKTLVIKLSKKGKSTLRHLRRAKLTITARATDLAGNTRTSKVSTTITR
jgi:hypothetical protein